MVTSDFRPEVEIRPFRACAMKNTQYNAYLWPNRGNSRVLKKSESRNPTLTSDFRPEVEILPSRSCPMHPAIIGTVRSLIVDLAMGQIPRSTERISSYHNNIIEIMIRTRRCDTCDALQLEAA